VASLTFPPDLHRYTGGVTATEVAARNYRELINELCDRFPGLTEEMLRKQALAINGLIIHEPLLESFGPDSELILVARIAGG